MQNLLTTQEVSQTLGKSVATINRWAAEGRIIPSFSFPGRKGARMYAPGEVERVRLLMIEPSDGEPIEAA